MTKKLLKLTLCTLLIISLFGCTSTSRSSSNSKVTSETKYSCDVKSLNINTEIHITGTNESYKIKGNYLTFVVDPLSLYDSAGNKIGYAGDSYHFIAQDSHTIYLYNKPVIEVVGEISFFGEKYTLYDMLQSMVGYVEMNTFNTGGIMYNEKNEIVAEYSSNLLFNDYDVTIYDNCKINKEAILLIFASYYSDIRADHANE